MHDPSLRRLRSGILFLLFVRTLWALLAVRASSAYRFVLHQAPIRVPSRTRTISIWHFISYIDMLFMYKNQSMDGCRRGDVIMVCLEPNWWDHVVYDGERLYVSAVNDRSDSGTYIRIGEGFVSTFRPFYPSYTLTENEIAELYDPELCDHGSNEDLDESHESEITDINCFPRVLTHEEIEELYHTHSNGLNIAIEDVVREVIEERTGKDCVIIRENE